MNDTTFKQKYETPTAVIVQLTVQSGLLINGSKDQYDPNEW